MPKKQNHPSRPKKLAKRRKMGKMEAILYPDFWKVSNQVGIS